MLAADADFEVRTRAAAKVASSPALTRKLARPSASARRIVQAVGGRAGQSLSYTITGPARITITAG